MIQAGTFPSRRPGPLAQRPLPCFSAISYDRTIGDFLGSAAAAAEGTPEPPPCEKVRHKGTEERIDNYEEEPRFGQHPTGGAPTREHRWVPLVRVIKRKVWYPQWLSFITTPAIALYKPQLHRPMFSTRPVLSHSACSSRQRAISRSGRRRRAASMTNEYSSWRSLRE